MNRYRKWRLKRIEKQLGTFSRVYDYVRRINAQGIETNVSKVKIANKIRELEAKRHQLQEKLNV